LQAVFSRALRKDIVTRLSTRKTQPRRDPLVGGARALMIFGLNMIIAATPTHRIFGESYQFTAW
jgi:hypothetical protein